LDQITITFHDGKTRSFNKGIILLEALKEAIPKLSSRAIAASVDNSIVDLSVNIEKDCSVQVLTYENPEGLHVFWHSASHVMAQSVKNLYPNARLGIGPAISNGFYYDFHLDDKITISDFDQIETEMARIIQEDQPFVREILSKQEALALFKKRGEEYKLELIHAIPDETITIYHNGLFIDLCRGPHVPSTGYIRFFKLLSIAGAYWHGDERNDIFQRIYGVAFPEKKHLNTYLQKLEQAKKRDHRRLGKELDLFSFHSEGPGFPFWHPNGMVLINQVTLYMQETLDKYGYKEIRTPLILNETLWHQSGHWDNYQKNMYFTEIDEQAYAVKPMNCPGGLLVYKNSPHSYRDFPLKLSEMGLVHRHEKSGVLHGLFRVRQFTQDDAHVYCTIDQMEEEIIHLIDLVDEVYKTFGFDTYMMELSTRPEKSIGTVEMWQTAEKALHNALIKKKAVFQINEGEGAFYGPKIDYHIQDSLGRMWQCGTIQVDFSMPERFNLEYVGSDGAKHRPVMIHRAILGSLERFIGILIEHFGGAFPVWLSPVQCIVIPISEKHHAYSEKIYNKIESRGIRSHLDNRNEKVGFKIREAEKKKIPFMLIIGDKEITQKMVSVRKRRIGDIGVKKLSDITKEIQSEIKRRDCH